MKTFTYIEIDNDILYLLLKDMSTKKNIIFATDDYDDLDKNINATAEINKKIITKYKEYIIRPRVMRRVEEQNKRTKSKAEVFTPSWLCNKMNNHLDEEWFDKKNIFNKENDKTWDTTKTKIIFNKSKTWKEYIKCKKIEITCGEAPYIVSRYDTTTGEYIDIKNRIGMLDRKLRVINENAKSINEWKKWVIQAYKSIYGYEYQGDSLLIARINLYLTYAEYLKERWNKEPTNDDITTLCKIINWNIWQMDGLTDKIPFVKQKENNEMTIFDFLNEDGEPKSKTKKTINDNKNANDEIETVDCYIYDWDKNKKIKFRNIKEQLKMKFDFCIGNPPYQGENHQQIYPDFYQSSKDIANFVDLIFPIGWQEPKDANNLRTLNNAETKEDKQIILIDNCHNVFAKDVNGAEWTNIILWKKDYNNNLNGKQKLLIDGKSEKIVHLDYDKSQIEKPAKILKLLECVKKYGEFTPMSTITSVRRPYGLSTDVIVDKNGTLGTEKYNLDPLKISKNKNSDIKIYCKGDIVRYVPSDYKFPKETNAKTKYKVFVPYAWGNMSENTGLGGAYSNIIIGRPFEVCTESYLESGCFDDFDTARKHAKYLFTKFLRALLYINKFSQHSTTAWGAIPTQDYHEDFWDESISAVNDALMNKYNVPQDIRDYVENNIQTKDESNIVNYDRKE